VVEFIVNANDPLSGADVKLSADGDIVTTGANKTGGGLADFAVDLGLVQHGSSISLDLVGHTLSYTKADGTAVTWGSTELQPLLNEFMAAGADEITIGSRSGGGFAFEDLRLDFGSDLLFA